ncbi:hypothetical protein LAZ67_12002933 [Cordylochernes scorpioides]|uniref:Uncharacterized protein n=1 Tax=Cordylochernes scorpioides TaxID=51811 RepID=A0ABY6L628_9ARAC|nr:hypothetical protein LAZ67_12002933 [Cordylochernes scorpioides]
MSCVGAGEAGAAGWHDAGGVRPEETPQLHQQCQCRDCGNRHLIKIGIQDEQRLYSMLGAAAHNVCSSCQSWPFLLELSQPATE